MKKILYVALLAAAFSGCVTTVKSIQHDIDTGLDERQGYLLLAVDTSQTLERIHIGGHRGFILTSDDLHAGESYILFKAPAGNYKIKSVEISSYHGYRLLGDSWSFSVKPNVISYVGDLKVKVNRWTLDGYFEIVNESSEALEFLEKSFPRLLGGRSIEYFGPGQDDFFEVVKGVERGLAGGRK